MAAPVARAPTVLVLAEEIAEIQRQVVGGLRPLLGVLGKAMRDPALQLQWSVFCIFTDRSWFFIQDCANGGCGCRALKCPTAAEHFVKDAS